MKTLLVIFRKELRSYFITPFGWVVLAFVALMHGLALSSALKGFRDTPIRETLAYVTLHTPTFWISFLFLFPLITMKLFADEEKTGTLETLLTAPVQTWQILLGKYLAALTYYLILLLPTLSHYLAFPILTDIPPPFTSGSLIGSFLILLLMGLFFTSLGCLSSAITSSQIIAGIVTITLLLFLYFLGYVPLIWGENFPAAPLFHHFSIQEHLHEFSKGIIDSRPIVHYLLSTLFILLLTHHLIDYRRWKN